LKDYNTGHLHLDYNKLNEIKERIGEVHMRFNAKYHEEKNENINIVCNVTHAYAFIFKLISIEIEVKHTLNSISIMLRLKMKSILMFNQRYHWYILF